MGVVSECFGRGDRSKGGGGLGEGLVGGRLDGDGWEVLAVRNGCARSSFPSRLAQDGILDTAAAIEISIAISIAIPI